MSNKNLLVVLVAALFVCSCASTGGPLVYQNGETGVAKLGRVELAFPGDFEIVGEKSYFGSETFNQDLVILRKQEGDVDTVIILSYQRVVPSSRFRFADPDEFSQGGVFPDRFVAGGVGPLTVAATYVKEAPIEKNKMSERVVCKVFTGFITYISTRYRIDIFQNFSPEPDKAKAGLNAEQLRELENFHQYSLNFVKENLREHGCMEWLAGKVDALKAGDGG